GGRLPWSPDDRHACSVLASPARGPDPPRVEALRVPWLQADLTPSAQANLEATLRLRAGAFPARRHLRGAGRPVPRAAPRARDRRRADVLPSTSAAGDRSACRVRGTRHRRTATPPTHFGAATGLAS